MKKHKDIALEIQEQHRNPATPSEAAQEFLANQIYQGRTKAVKRKENK